MGPWNKTPEERERIRTSVRAAGQKRRDDFVDRNPNRPSVRQRRMHHHDKHAATKDGHRPDDPNAVTSNKWKQQQIDALGAERHAGGIRREGHEVFDENVDYGQRVSAFGNVERNVSDEQGGGYDVQGDEMVDLTDGEEDQAFAKVGMYGQDYGYSKERRQHEAQTGTSLGRLAKPGAGDKEWEQTVARAR